MNELRRIDLPDIIANFKGKFISLYKLYFLARYPHGKLYAVIRFHLRVPSPLLINSIDCELRILNNINNNNNKRK